MHRVVVGLGFGDEGKGSVVDFLCHDSPVHTVVRFNGGAQAAHNVVLPDGRHHTFSQFGSGTFAGAKTYLSEHMLVNPLFLEPERANLELCGVKTEGLLTVHEEALVTTPFHVAANRLRELQRDHRHGSCGMGIGETVESCLLRPTSALRVKDLSDLDSSVEKLQYLQKRYWEMFKELRPNEAQERELSIIHDPRMIEWCIEGFYEGFSKKYEVVASNYLQGLLSKEDLVFEGAQGVLLDEHYGFNPHTTWSRTTPSNARSLLRGQEARVIGVTRAYHTRHGAGPFPTEEPSLQYPDHNDTGLWQGSFRFGSLDLILLQYAQAHAVAHEVAVTCLDHLPKEGVQDVRLRVGVDYEGCLGSDWTSMITAAQGSPRGDAQARFIEARRPVYEYVCTREAVVGKIRGALQIPVTLISEGPTHKDKKWL